LPEPPSFPHLRGFARPLMTTQGMGSRVSQQLLCHKPGLMFSLKNRAFCVIREDKASRAKEAKLPKD
jgi:hypothetical protein